MYIRYEYSSYSGQTFITQSEIDDFLKSQFKNDRGWGDERSDMNLKVDGTFCVLAALVKKLFEKGMLTLEDIEDMIPYKNYIRLISIDAERDFNL